MADEYLRSVLISPKVENILVEAKAKSSPPCVPDLTNEEKSLTIVKSTHEHFEKSIRDFGYWQLKKMNQMYKTCTDYNVVNMFLLGLLQDALSQSIDGMKINEQENSFNVFIARFLTTDKWSEIFEEEEELNAVIQATLDMTLARDFLNFRQKLRMAIHLIYVPIKHYIEELERQFKIQNQILLQKKK